MTETIKVSESLELHAVAENHVTPLYQLICKNKTVTAVAKLAAVCSK
ncbi:ribosomal-protein-serine N-acetyltransferase [Escherichia coli]|nr:ribosomal-protein-serine N-acetyltransferase [Escherichia coli]